MIAPVMAQMIRSLVAEALRLIVLGVGCLAGDEFGDVIVQRGERGAELRSTAVPLAARPTGIVRGRR